MKFDSSEAEKNYASLSLGLNTYVANVFASYEQTISTLTDKLKEANEEIALLKGTETAPEVEDE